MGKHAHISYQPRLLGAAEAAAYMGVSETKLRGLNIPRRMMDGRRLFDRFDLDRFASDLPYEKDTLGENTCDAVFD
ncbi:helix-turn-helix domain-containing protein [Pseudogemmobacter faecipullorum]|uniref:DNA-binding protein n=1 Tax=Pseudogemmobacter faecipullorum TaxID=2755041 RepID=A0ABS8CSQ9_9RHOB|nr:helix-turn-helix domain-containing protein [Pseudogemmobacter faecipullorum]MCB5412394.1 DNA-binding protein [Pseudogemmobacter faecipullorum]